MLTELLVGLSAVSVAANVYLTITSGRAAACSAQRAESYAQQAHVTESNTARFTTKAHEHMVTTEGHRAACHDHSLDAASARDAARESRDSSRAFSLTAECNSKEAKAFAEAAELHDPARLAARLVRVEGRTTELGNEGTEVKADLTFIHRRIRQSDVSIRQDTHAEFTKVGTAIEEIQEHMDTLASELTTVVGVVALPTRPGNHIR